MNKLRIIVIALAVLILVASTLSVDAASINSGQANYPWTDQLFKDAEDGIVNLSSEFVGPYQIPMLSYNRAGLHHIYQAFLATPAVPGNCGPNNAWYCDSWQDSSLVPNTVSQMATHQYIDTHVIRWVYSTGTLLRGVYLELMNDMTFVDADFMDFVELDKFGSTMIGTPSLQIRSGGQTEIAFTILGSGDLYPYSLVYVHYVGGSNTSCKDAGSPYQCDVIDSSLGYGSMGAPSLQLDDNNNAGIAYYKNGEVMYAYPHASLPGWPSNCGTVDEPWRCISIFAGQPTGTVGRDIKLAMGSSSVDRGIAFTYDDELIPVTLYHAEYVGADGNCGLDSRFGGTSDYRFHCVDLVNYYYQSDYDFSIDIDPDGYSVIATEYRTEDLANLNLNLVYENARAGLPGTGWVLQHIDGAPVSDVETGALADVAISDLGRSFISYLQEEPYELDDLKIAFQQYRAVLPIVSK